MSSTTVTTEHPEYIERKAQWEQMRDVIAGQDAVKEKGVLYLPPINSSDSKSEANYKVYLQVADYYNATGLTRDSYSGMIFRKEPIPSDNIPDNMINNIDLEGTPLASFVEKVTDEVLDVGRVLLVADLPKVTLTNVTVADAESSGIRPYIKMYTTESFINWDYKIIGNVSVLSLVVVKEVVSNNDDIFSHDTKVQFRVFRLDENDVYIQEVYTEQGQLIDTETVTPMFNGNKLNFLPVRIINVNTLKAETEKPPLYDLSNTNLSHYRTSADLNISLRMFGRSTAVYKVPISHFSAFVEQSKDGIEYGSTKAIVLPIGLGGEMPDVSYLEPNADLTMLISQTERLEKRMAAQGARMLEPTKRGVESAQAIRLDMLGEVSILASIALNVSRGVSELLALITNDPESSILLNTDFLGGNIDANMVNSLLSTLQANQITSEQFVEALIRGEAVIPLDVAESTKVPDNAEDNALESGGNSDNVTQTEEE